MNPAREVKTERFSRTEGKTPEFVEGEVQRLLGVIETSTHTGLRDSALLGVLAYTFARIGAVVNLKVEDYYRLNSNKGTKRDMAISLIPFDRLDFRTLGYPQNGAPFSPPILGVEFRSCLAASRPRSHTRRAG